MNNKRPRYFVYSALFQHSICSYIQIISHICVLQRYSNSFSFRVSARHLLWKEDFMEDYVLNCLFLVGLPLHSKLQIVRQADSWAGHIQLTMSKHWTPQPDADSLHSLTLWLVDGQGECRPDRKLPALPLKRIFSRLRDEHYPWN